MKSDNKCLRELYVEISSKCYLKCRHCSSEADNFKNELIDTSTVYRIINEGKELGADSLTISGGEPLLHPGIFNIIEYAKQNGFNIKLYSCGVLKNNEELVSLDETIFSKLKKAGVDTVIFSLHGKPETHDYITTISGSYDIALESIKKAIGFSLNVEIHMVPMKKNYLEIEHILSVAQECGIEQISLLRLVPQGRLRENIDLNMEKDDYKFLKKIINDLRKENKKVRIGAPFSCLITDRPNFCSAGQNKLLLAPNGDVYPCEAFKTKLKGKTSNIYHDSLYEIWNNDVALNKIRSLKLEDIEYCNHCPKLYTCHGGCHGQRLIANGLLNLGPDPICLENK